MMCLGLDDLTFFFRISGVDNLARLGAFFAGVILRAAGPGSN